MLAPLATVLLLTQQQKTAEQIYESITPSILTLSVERSHGITAVGTAFLAVGKGVAVTAWHVLKGARSITAKFSDGHQADVAGVIDKDVNLDIALIRIEAGDRPVLPIADSEPKVGARAYVIGSPKGLDFSISDGIISQMPFLGSGKLYQFTCPVSPGNSGGPLLDSSGQVLGVVSWQLRDAQNLNFAVPATTLQGLNQNKNVVPFTKLGSEEPTTAEVLLTVSDDKITDLLSQVEIKSKPEADGTGKTAFLFDNDGTKVSLFQYANDSKTGATTSLSVSAGYQAGPGADLFKINAFNRAHRFVRAYRDPNGAIYVENDLNIDRGVGTANVLRFVTDFQEIVHLFESEVLGKSSDQKTEHREFRPNSSGDTLFSVADDKSLLGLLKDCGFAAKSSDDGTGKNRFTFNVGKASVSLYQFSDDEKDPTTSLTLSVGYDLQKSADVKQLNSFNEENRFLKAFADDEGDPFLVSDLDLHGGVTIETLRAFVKNYVREIPAFEKSFIGKD